MSRSRKVFLNAYRETCLATTFPSVREKCWLSGTVAPLFLWRLLREEEVGFHLPHWPLPLHAPPSILSFFPRNKQVLPQSAAAASIPAWHATMLPDQLGCTQAVTQSQHIHMQVTFTAALRGLLPHDLNDMCNIAHTGFVKAFNSSVFKVHFDQEQECFY